MKPNMADPISISNLFQLPLAGVEKCLASLRVAQLISHEFPDYLVLRGGLAAQLHIEEPAHQRLSGDIDFYVPEQGLDFGKLQHSIASIARRTPMISSMVCLSNEGYSIQIPMLSFRLQVACFTDCQYAFKSDIKLDVTAAPFDIPAIAMQSPILGIEISAPIDVVPRGYVIAEKVLKLATRGVDFPSRQPASLCKQVYDLSNLIMNSSWSKDHDMIRDYLLAMLPREGAFRSTTFSYMDLLRVIKNGLLVWREYASSEQGCLAIRQFENNCVPSPSRAGLDTWIDRTDRVGQLIELLLHVADTE